MNAYQKAWTPERRAAQSARMRASNPMKQPEVAARVTASRAEGGKQYRPKPCAVGCTCKRHNGEARRRGAIARWEKATPADREAQAEVMRRNLRARWSEYDQRRVSKERMLKPDDYEVMLDERVWPEGDVFDVAEQLGVHAPTLPTLRKYGLTERDWLELLAAQGWSCAVCWRRSKGFVIDHEHVPFWKGKEPAERKRFVRGILCPYDNYRVVPSRMSGAEAQRMATYLQRYEQARDVRLRKAKRA